MALRTSIVDADWKQPSEPTDPAVAGIQLIREVTQINAINEAGIMATLNATVAITDPKCDGVTYTGTYYLSDLESIAQDSGEFAGSVTIREKLTKIWTITNEASLPTKIDMRGKDIVNAFSLSSSIEEFIAYQWLYLNPANVAIIEALSVTAPSGYTEVKRRTDIEARGDRTCTLSILYKKVTQTAWGGAADVEGYDNYGYYNSTAHTAVDKGEKTIYTREWHGIQNSDQATAMTQLIDGNSTYTHILTGYIIMDVQVRDQQDGGLTLVQRQIQQVNNVDVAGKRVDDPLGLQPIVIDVIETIYDDFTAQGMTAAVSTNENMPPSGYVLEVLPPELKDNGLYRRVYRYIKATYPNALRTIKKQNGETSSAYAPTYGYEHAEQGANTIAKAGNRLSYTAPSVDVDNITAITQLLNTEPLTSTPSAADSTVSVVAVQSQLGSSGDVTINQTLAKINADVAGTTKGYVTTTGSAATAGAYLLERGKNISSQSTTLKRMWPAVTVANAVILCKSGGEAVKDVIFENETYKHTNATIAYDMSTGLCDVIQECDTGKTNTYNLGWWLHTGHKEVFEQHLETFNGTEIWNVLTQQLETTSEGEAIAFLNGTIPYAFTPGTPAWTLTCPQIGSTHNRSVVQAREDTVYDARRVLFSHNDTFQAAPTI